MTDGKLHSLYKPLIFKILSLSNDPYNKGERLLMLCKFERQSSSKEDNFREGIVWSFAQ
jgi:hypothetical protein